MLMEVFKKRKRETYDAVFNEAWTEDYFFILVNNVPTSKSCTQLVFYFSSIYVKSDDRWIVRILGR
jgi:hypothetical protein